MSASIDATLRHLNDCACCEGVSTETPAVVDNRPGLAAVAYRTGTYAVFKDTMLSRLAGSRQQALGALATRDDDDFSIALLDAWATVGDVLTFYQERIANEAYLRTATERFSVLELARLIAYQLRPGVAASAYLAFTIEDTPGALGQALSVGTTAQIAPGPPPPITIGVGTRVQSIPGPDEQAQTFETAEKIEARGEWNAMKPRLAQPQDITEFSEQTVILQGTANNVKQGDTLLIINTAGTRTLKTISRVTPNEDSKTTRVDFISPPPQLPNYVRASGLATGSVYDFPTKVELVDSVIQTLIGKSWNDQELSVLLKIQGWSVQSLVASIARRTAQRAPAAGTGVFAFRQRASIFGHNAPIWNSLPANLRVDTRIERSKPDGTFDGFQFIPAAFLTSWENRTIEDDAAPTGSQRSVYLDSTSPGIIKDSWIALMSPTVLQPAVLKVFDNLETTRSDFAITAKVSRLRVESIGSLADFKMRTTAVLAQSEQLSLADLPIVDPVRGDTVTLDRTHLGLKIGQRVILTGERNDLAGIIASETLPLKRVIIEGGFTVLTFDRSLTYSYVRKTVTINANVALATHGETVEEVLGSGDAGQSFQRFTLRQPPLTYVSASTPSGAQSTLEMRVNDILWNEVPDLFGHGPDERIYVTRLDDDGKTTVIFGNGRTGSRLPTGQENIKAKYRKGIGLPGLVKADQLTQLMTRPLGLKGATNPNPATSAAGRERLEEARRNAPLTVLTLGRIVSLQDYEDFALAFSGVAKALATWIWFGERRGVFVTVAGANGAEIKVDSVLYKNLLNAMLAAGDSSVPLRVKSYQPRLFKLSATVKVHPDYLPERVFVALDQKLREQFSFDARRFGQPVHLSEVIAVIQNTQGVVAVAVKELRRSDETGTRTPLVAAIPRPADGEVIAAELLTLDPRSIVLEELK